MPINCYSRRFIPTPVRFMDQCSPIPIAGCWIWMGTIASSAGGKLPYGRFWMNGKNEPAHRAAWRLFRGEIPDGAVVCHSCDVPECVNPSHLFLGTHRDNTRDMASKGRNEPMLATRRGERNNFAKLSLAQVQEILEAPGSQRQIAAKYGVSQPCVSLIKRGKNWKHADR